ncbi:MAG TPA: RNA polymerase sigma factor [Polyangiaceae bacterium]|nr:RNA polymerase sigma factor [Polyangiaceae bacterium]
MAAPAFSIQSSKATLLGDPTLREGLLQYARRRLPPAEVEDIVQNTLTDALIAEDPPSDPAEFRRWVHGIVRHKIADNYRRRQRLPVPSAEVDQNAAAASPSVSELGQWIESELPKTDHAQATLHWLLREGEGETLEEIARDVDLPAPRVRQRVSRLRRHLHTRWLALGAAGLITLLGAGALLYRASKQAVVLPSIAREPLTPLERARSLRQEALRQCASGAYPECIAGLDQARELDPDGERASAIGDARAAAASAERPRPAPRLPAGSPSTSPPNNQPGERPYVPNELAPKQATPQKPVQKSPPLGALQKPSGVPSKKMPSYELPNQQPASKQFKTKKD